MHSTVLRMVIIGSGTPAKDLSYNTAMHRLSQHLHCQEHEALGAYVIREKQFPIWKD